MQALCFLKKLRMFSLNQSIEEVIAIDKKATYLAKFHLDAVLLHAL